MPYPTYTNIITGPAILQFGGVSYYSKGGIKVSLKRDTFVVEADGHGQVDERMKSQMVEVSFRPVGAFTNAAGLAGHFPALSSIGKSVFNPAGAADVPLVIHTFDGQKITYGRAAITKSPVLNLKTTDTIFGDMTFTCLGKTATAATSAAYFRALTTATFADATFEETAIITDRYYAAWGASPYDAMLAADGFEFTIEQKLKPIETDGWGVMDMVLESLVATAKFAPANLTEAQVDTMLALQNTGALLPGQSIAKAGTSLVLTGSQMVITLANAGPKDAEYEFSTASNRFKGVMFASRRTWTSGIANAMWTFADAP